MTDEKTQEPSGFLTQALTLANRTDSPTRWIFEFYLVCAICEGLHLIANAIAKDKS